MADHLKTTFEKYQFHAFVTLVGIVMTFYWNSQTAAQKDREETRKDIAVLTQQMAVAITKIDNSDHYQRATDIEVKELSKRIGVLEKSNAQHEQQLRQLNK